ncbi:MAG: MoaD/ThiS family protein [Sphingomonadales bacterium]|nr:MoaD/ThiS family protein [Sphingomonadales bacterium]
MAMLLFLGRLEDRAGAPQQVLALAGPTPLAGVLDRLPAELAAALVAPGVRMARNGTLVSPQGLVIDDGDELAFLPPVSGG